MIKNFFLKSVVWIAWVALTLSIATFCTFFVRFEPFKYDYESIVGLLAVFIGICTTFIVGWQIFSSFEVKGYIKENMLLFNQLNEQLNNTREITDDLNRKIIESEQITNKIQSDFEQTIKRIEDQDAFGKARMMHSKGYALSSSQLLTTYFSFYLAMDIYINLKNVGEFLVTVGDIHTCVNKMKITLDELKRSTDTELKKKLIEKFELDSLSYVNPTVDGYIGSWQADRFNELYPSRIGLLLELNIKRKEILEEVIEINRQILAEGANQ